MPRAWAHASTFTAADEAKRTPTSGAAPVAGRPGPFRLADPDFVVMVLYSRNAAGRKTRTPAEPVRSVPGASTGSSREGTAVGCAFMPMHPFGAESALRG